MTTHAVKAGSVTLEIRPWTNAKGQKWHRAEYYGADGKRRHVTGSTLKVARAKALAKAQELAKGVVDFSALSPHQIRAIRRLLDADPQLALVDDFLLWKSKMLPDKPTGEAVAEFLKAKEKNAGRSTQNVLTLRKYLNPLSALFGSSPLSSITLPDLEAFVASNPNHSNRTRRNCRGAVVTFFRWCRVREFLPDAPTVAEKLERPIVADTVPETYTPDQLAILVDNVKPDYKPWLVTAALAGVRTDEIAPVSGSRKSPLDWSDFHWDRNLLIVRPETAKMKRRRVIPITPKLREILFPLRKSSGPILDAIPPTKLGRGKDAVAETVRLGKLIGGWKPNALRHSFISYRAAQVGLGKTAMEAGNSEAEAKRSYNNAKGGDEANRWFQVLKSSPELRVVATG